MWDNIVDFNTTDPSNLFDNTIFLWIWNPHKKPPHIGISIRNNYFSLRRDRVEMKLHALSQIHKIQRARIPVIWVGITKNIALETIAIEFVKYTSCVEDECSCLFPILRGIGASNDQFLLKDLLLELDSKYEIGPIYSHCLPSNWVDIPTYTTQEVQENWLNSKKQNDGNQIAKSRVY